MQEETGSRGFSRHAMGVVAALVLLASAVAPSGTASADPMDACDFELLAEPGDYVTVTGTITQETDAISEYFLQSVECYGENALLEADSAAARQELDRCVGGYAVVGGWAEEHCFVSPFSVDEWCYLFLYADDVLC